MSKSDGFDKTRATPSNQIASNTTDPTFASGSGSEQTRVSESIGSQVGPYELIEQIGEGGMGQVFKAEQHKPVHRLVAVKVIKAGMDSRQVVARFEAERQALAMMDHPNIARVLDAGTTPNGYPYFVMELVRGDPIHQFCDRKQFSPKQRLELFMQVCNAVQHAHQKGIIHRDIKPSNVLVSEVDNAPQVKVIDFGLAKATEQRLTEKSLFTAIGQFVGTPAYMSPEQADLGSVDIDTRTDVYSLGVLLYELLAGVTPLDVASLRKAGYEEIQRLIREQDPPRMSTRLSSMGGDSSATAHKRSTNPHSLTQMLRGDLDVIVMKSLEKDRDRRYETPASFAEDIQRFLNREVILARPASKAYRIRRFVQRNKLVVVASTLVLASMVVGTVVSLSQASRARTAEELANNRLKEVQAEQAKTTKALAETEVERDRALRAEQTAAAEAATATAINEFLKYDLLAEAAPSRNPRNRQITVEELVAKAAAGVSEKFKDRPVVQADIRSTIGETMAALSNLPEAEEQFAMALELMTEHLGEEHPDTIMGVNNLGLLQKFQGKYDLAEKNYKRALELHRKVSGELDAKTLGTLNNLAMLYSTQEKYDLAEPLFVESLKGSRQTQGDDHPDTLQTMNNLAGLYRSTKKFDDAEALLLEALKIRKRVLGDEHPETINSMGALALWYQDLDRFEEAEEMFKRVIELSSRVSGPQHYVTLIFKNNFGNFYKRQEQFDLAEPILVEVLKGRQQEIGKDHDHTLGTMLTLANLYREENEFEKAEPLYRDRCDLIAQKNGADSLEYAGALNSFGKELLNQQRFESATENLRKCEKIQAASPTVNPLQVAHVKSLLGASLAGEAMTLPVSDKEGRTAKFLLAEPLLIAGFEGLKNSEFAKTEDGVAEVAEAVDRIVAFYSARNEPGDTEKADNWKTKRTIEPNK